VIQRSDLTTIASGESVNLRVKVLRKLPVDRIIMENVFRNTFKKVEVMKDGCVGEKFEDFSNTTVRFV